MGGNAAEAHPCGFKWVTEAKANRGAKLIVIDPRFTRSASVSDLYAPIRQGTDIAFLLGLINYCIQNDKVQWDYVKAFTSYDIDALVLLLRQDATASMPPFALWLAGRDDIAAWHLGPGHECRGSRLVPLEVNGSPAFAAYKQSPDGHRPFSIQVLDLDGDRIARITYFLDTSLFERFGLPATL